MKESIREIVGKTISGTIAAKNKNCSPHIQLFLVFTDGTHFEIYGDDFTCCAGVDRGDGEKAAEYAQKCGAEITEIYLEPYEP